MVDLKESYPYMLKGLHPCLLLSNYHCLSHSPIIQVIPISSSSKPMPMHVELNSDCGLDKEKSYALCEQITTVGKNALKYQIGKVSYTQLNQIQQATMMQLGFSNNVTNMEDFKEVSRMIENIEELDRYLKTFKSDEILEERRIALKCLENYVIHHSINIDLGKFYNEKFNEDRWEVCAERV